MRFNGKQLGSSSASWVLDFEGVLMLREKKADMIFKHAHVLSEHWCRLRGNLLLICRTNDHRCTELHSLVVLEFHEVIPAPQEENAPSGFYICFPRTYDSSLFFVARNLHERAQWMGALQASGLHPVLTRITELRNRVGNLSKSKSSQNVSQRLASDYYSVDKNNGVTANRATTPEFSALHSIKSSESLNKSPTDSQASAYGGLEVAISCQSLPQISLAKPLSSCVSVYLHTPGISQSQYSFATSSEASFAFESFTKWAEVGRTEINELNNNPQYSRTVFLAANKYNYDSIVMFRVWEICEANSALTQLAGVTEVNVTSLENNTELTLPLKSFGEAVQFHTICLRVSYRLPSSIDEALQRIDCPTFHLRSICVNLMCKQFSFPHVSANHRSGHLPSFVARDGLMRVVEFMGESSLGLTVPIDFLKCVVQSERLLHASLLRAAMSNPHLETCRTDLLRSMKRELDFYEKSLRILSDYSGPPFKRSKDKSSASLEFLPVNLHVNRMGVVDNTNNIIMHYDIVTVGSFSAHCRGFSSSVGGGLLRLAKSYPESCELDRTGGSALFLLQQGCQCVLDIKNEILTWARSVTAQMIRGEMVGDNTAMSKFLRLLSHLKRISQDPLIVKRIQFQVIDETVVQLQNLLRGANVTRLEATRSLEQAKQRLLHLIEDAWQEGIARDYLWPLVLKSMAPCFASTTNPEAVASFSGQPSTSPDCDGAHRRKILLSHSYHMKRNLEADDDDKDPDQGPPMRPNLSAATDIPSSSELPKPGATLPADLWALFQTRAIICLSQALTAVLTALVNDFARWTTVTWQQMSLCGLPLYFEGLLSCSFSEYGMLEDMSWSVRNLRHFKITVRPQSLMDDKNIRSDSLQPKTLFIGRRKCVVACPDRVWALAPENIRSKNQICLSVHPFMFNVGINEMQIFAERIKGVELQDGINTDGVESLQQYYDHYVKNLSLPGKTPDGMDVSMVLKQLRQEVAAHRNKPIQILYLAQQISHSLNVIRFTSCKSAKDRTSMGVTVEWTRWLESCAGLPPEQLEETLKCIRSRGLRLENAFKNVGVRRFAFNTMQLLSFPKLYRPPVGTFGGLTDT